MQIQKLLGLIALSLFALPGVVDAQSQIRVLVTYQTGANLLGTNPQVTRIQQAIDTSGASSSAQIDLVNGGQRFALTGSSFGSTADLVYTNLPLGTNVGALRNQYAADLVVVFYPSLPEDYCGLNKATHWVPDGDLIPPLGLDHRGKESAYILLVSTAPGCRDTKPWLTAHEFGHAMGMAHDVSMLNDGPGINSNARADYDEPIGDNGAFTIVAVNPHGFGPELCDIIQTCLRRSRFSGDFRRSSQHIH